MEKCLFLTLLGGYMAVAMCRKCLFQNYLNIFCFNSNTDTFILFICLYLYMCIYHKKYLYPYETSGMSPSAFTHCISYGTNLRYTYFTLLYFHLMQLNTSTTLPRRGNLFFLILIVSPKLVILIQ